jgi:hypothetical protein
MNDMTALTESLLLNLPSGDLLVIVYKLCDHRIPEYETKEDLVKIAGKMLDRAGALLTGQTLPADLHLIDRLAY